MLCLVVLLEAVIGDQDVSRNNETVLWRIEWPEVCTENHNAKVDVHVVVVLFHAFFERVRQVLAKAHIYNISEQSRA